VTPDSNPADEAREAARRAYEIGTDGVVIIPGDAYEDGYDAGWDAARRVTPEGVERAAEAVYAVNFRRPWVEADGVLQRRAREEVRAVITALGLAVDE
jgi:hypothetical protein